MCYNTKQTQKTKGRFSRLLRHPVSKWRGPILVSVLHKFATHLLRHLPTYLQPRDPHGENGNGGCGQCSTPKTSTKPRHRPTHSTSFAWMSMSASCGTAVSPAKSLIISGSSSHRLAEAPASVAANTGSQYAAAARASDRTITHTLSSLVLFSSYSRIGQFPQNRISTI